MAKLEDTTKFNPRLGKKELALLSRLCDAVSVSGDEQEVRAIVLEELRDYADVTKVDAMGNVLVRREGKGADRVRVMVAAHMDEVGFMIVKDEGDGVFEFRVIGGVPAPVGWQAGYHRTGSYPRRDWRQSHPPYHT